MTRQPDDIAGRQMLHYPQPDGSWAKDIPPTEALGRYIAAYQSDHECCHHVVAAEAVLAERERELLELKGPCSNKQCRSHYAHSGPCDCR
jgi:hypothetical protein